MDQPAASPPVDRARNAWHALDVEAAIRRLSGDAANGLSQAEALRRQARFGENRLITVDRDRWYQILARQFLSILILILVAAAAVSAALGDIGDTLTIFAIVLLNGALGFVQEWRAGRAMAALQRMLSPRCMVLRDGVEREIDAVALVPGDIVALETGDRVPADLRLIEALNLRADESPLTGESGSVSKDVTPVDADAPLASRASMAWMGTAVTNGRARGIVAETGMATEFGRIADLTQTVVEETTPLQHKLAGLGKQLGIFSIAISILVAVAGVALGKQLLEMFLTGVSLAVAVVPEGLPAVVTITLALGIRTMVRRRALLRRLQAAEALGAATVICTDKTGTLTENEMTVQRIWLPRADIEVTGAGYDPAGHFVRAGQRLDYHRNDLLALLETGLVCNHARLVRDGDGWRQIGEPTEAALVVAACKAWLDPDDRPPLVGEFSFNSARKRMTVIALRMTGLVAHMKGAPEVIIERCSRILDGDAERPITDADRDAATSAFTRMAESGLRTLALARRDLADGPVGGEAEVETDLTLLGIVGIIDPSRPEVPAAIRLARGAGIRVIMITGDAAATALAIARQIGLGASRAIAGNDLAGMDDAALIDALAGDVVFARTTPEHKLRIVSLLQHRGNVVGMTGDGVNDAPALRKADIGIAMGIRGTDVAKGASDMILTDDNFATIIGAVEEGRRQYDNIQKFVRYLLSSNTAEIIAIFVNILLGGPLILLPVQILWMNLITDGMTAVALGMEPAEKRVMQRRPHPPHAPILDRAGVLTILALSVYMGAATLWLFHHYLAGGGAERVVLAQTVAFTGLIMLEKVNVFNFRTLHDPIGVIGFFSNPWILVAWAANLGLQLCAVYVPLMQDALHTVPLGWRDWALIMVLALPVFGVWELQKWLRWRAGRDPAAGDG